MTEKAKTILIGGFILIACLAMIGMLLFLRPSVGDGKKTLYVCFTSIEKIQIGTRVTFAGKPVGEVYAINPIYDARNQPTGRSGHVCFYELELHIDSHTVVYDTDEITVHTTGLMGERTIAIIPQAVRKGQPSYPVTDQVMYGKSGDPVEETLNQIRIIGTKVGDTLDELKNILQDNRAEIPQALHSIQRATAEIAEALDQVNSTHLVIHLNQMIESFQEASRKIDSLLTEWKAAGLGKSFPELVENLGSFTKSLQGDGKMGNFMSNLTELTANLKNFSSTLSPEGTIGKLFHSDEVYLKITSLMTKMNILLDDVNSYGVLFHLNKSWQRERLRRINMINQLSCPRDFHHYFNCEMREIALSLSRIEKTVIKARCYPGGTRCFSESFSQLYDQLDTMEETLKAFQQEMIDCSGGCP